MCFLSTPFLTSVNCFSFLPSQTKIKRFLPAKLCTEERRGELAVEIQKRHKTHSGKSIPEVQRAYLKHVKGWKVSPRPLLSFLLPWLLVTTSVLLSPSFSVSPVLLEHACSLAIALVC